MAITMFYTITSFVRGVAIIRGSTNRSVLDDADTIAAPLQPEIADDDPGKDAIMNALLRDVIATGHYSAYRWQESDE